MQLPYKKIMLFHNNFASLALSVYLQLLFGLQPI